MPTSVKTSQFIKFGETWHSLNGRKTENVNFTVLIFRFDHDGILVTNFYANETVLKLPPA